MSEPRELDVTHLLERRSCGGCETLSDAIDAASDQDQITWLTDRGRRIAAIVPVDVAGQAVRDVLATPVATGPRSRTGIRQRTGGGSWRPATDSGP